LLPLLMVAVTHTSAHTEPSHASAHVKPSSHASHATSTREAHADTLPSTHPTTHASITTKENVEPAGQRRRMDTYS
jgi:hypothetical protein